MRCPDTVLWCACARGCWPLPTPSLQVITSDHIHKAAEHFMGEIRWYWGIMWPAFERVRCLTRPGSGDAAKVRVAVFTCCFGGLLCACALFLFVCEGGGRGAAAQSGANAWCVRELGRACVWLSIC